MVRSKIAMEKYGQTGMNVQIFYLDIFILAIFFSSHVFVFIYFLAIMVIVIFTWPFMTINLVIITHYHYYEL